MTDPVLAGAAAHPPAELDRRFYAFVVDRLIAWSLYAVALTFAYRSLMEPGDVVAGVAVVLAAVVVVGVAFALPLGLAGVSPGKAVVGLRLVDAETGAPVGAGRALLRASVLGVAGLPTFGIGVATLAWTAVMDPGRRRQGWHDHLTDALVVDVRPVPVAEEAVEERPRQVVNLTALRLVPAGAAAAPHAVPTPQRAARPTAPPAQPAAVGAPPPAAPPPSTPPPSTPPPSTPPPSTPPPSTPPPSTPPPSTPPPVVRVSQLGPPLVAAPRTPEQPPRWRVSFDTGETFVVEGLTLVGRRPEARGGETVVRLVPLRSEDMSLSKTHAQFQATPAGALVVMDRGSTNGSVVIRQGVSKALTPGRPATLLAGDKVCFGDRQMTVETA